MSQEQDKIFFRNFSLSLAIIAVMMVVFYVIAQFAGTDEEADAKMRAAAVAKATEPVGEVAVAGEESATEEVASTGGAVDGKAVYEGLCVSCHGVPAMASMIPQTGDAAAWDDRMAKGIDTLYDHAINGFTGDMGMMPARGSNPDLSDEEVKAAVDYMVEQLSADASAGGEQASVDGKAVYEGLCTNCHGIAALAAMIPQTGDAAVWEARIAKGMDTLYANAINGFTGDLGMMPPRGSNPALSDEEVKAAVDYMIEQSK